jgi:dTDP-4-amino-4,6-dideoxygalactose transaminase
MTKEVNRIKKPKDRIIINTGNGSSALRLILRELHLRQGDKIAVPLLTCERVIKAIIAEGFVPAFVDISTDQLLSNTNDYVRVANRDHVSAIIAVSMWGYPVDIDAISQGTSNSIVIIHDCALSLGSEKNSEADESRSRYSFYSYGIGKPICMGFGGKAELTSTSLDLEYELESPINLIYNSMKCLGKSFLFTPQIYRFARHLGKILNSDNQYSPIMEDITLLPDKFLFIENRKIQELKNRINLARSTVVTIKKRFDDLNFSTIAEEPGISWNYWMYPVLAPVGVDTGEIVKKMEAQGFEIGLPYQRTIRLAKEYWEYKDSCENIEKNSSRIFTIPSPHQFSKNNLEKFIDAFSLSIRSLNVHK